MNVRWAAPLPVLQDSPKAKKSEKRGDGAEKGAKKERTPEEDSVRAMRRGEKARALPLFRATAPLPFTLRANFRRIARDRDSTSKVRYAGTLIVRDDSGSERQIPVELRTRGHFRLMARNCRFVNLLVLFPNDGLKGTPFQGQESMKLGAHCHDDDRYQNYLLKEYAAYRMYNALTDVSFRVRLATGTYVDSASGDVLATRPAFWIEDEQDVAGRAGGRMKELRRALFEDVDAATLNTMTMFEYLIGNTDFSLYSLHNVRIISHPTGKLLPVPYDFDFSGLVHTSYAHPDPKLAIRDVRHRLYRGPCRTPDELAAVAARLAERRDAILATLGEVPALATGDAREVREYLDEFFEMARDPKRVKREISDGCQARPGV